MREFAVSAGSQSLSATTVIFINPTGAPSMNLEFLRFWLSQSANATSAQQRVQIETQTTGWGLFTAATPAKLKKADPNASVIVGGTVGAAGTAGIVSTSEGAGTKTTIFEDNFNVLNGWLNVPTPPETIIIPAGFASGLGMFFPTAPGTAAGWGIGTNFREV